MWSSGRMAAAQQSRQPILIGVLAPFSHIDGQSIVNGAQLAADEINKSGGIDGRPVKLMLYDTHLSAAEAVRAMQRAVQQDHVVAMTGVFTSEVALAVEPWAARLKVPTLYTGAATTVITEMVHKDYPTYKYVFHPFTNSHFLAEEVCGFAKDVLVGQLHYKTAVEMSEDADWTKPVDASYKQCLATSGLKVLDYVRFSPNTNDFTPIYQKIEGLHPDVILTAIAHVGVAPTVQWKQQRVPALLAGISGQAGSTAFWKATNGACEGVVTQTTDAGGAAVTPLAATFSKAYSARFGVDPAYNAFSEGDAILALKHAIDAAKSTDGDALVLALEKVDFVGLQGRIAFYGRDDQYTHGLRYGPGYVTGVNFQWQNGKQVVIWPEKIAQGKIQLPAFAEK
ncbi:MAG: ABC transporter substrate-binding protein [bacterium]|nr:ABC transporter substrate-binding protein [bacterium]